MLKKIILFAILIIIVIQAQPYNTITYTTQIIDFKADSLKTTTVFPLGDNEGLNITVSANDTSAPGFANDSIVAYWGLQYGRLTTNYMGQRDTMWLEPTKIIDTFHIVSANIKTENSFSLIDSLEPLAICTTSVSGYAFQSRVIQPYRFPIARIKIKGNTGNELTSFLRLRIEVSQPKYNRVDIGQSKQPNE